MERIRKRLVQLLIQDKIKEINTDVVNKKYVSFVTSEGAAYTFITTEEGGCTYSNNCKGQLFKIVEGLITLKIDLKKNVGLLKMLIEIYMHYMIKNLYK